MTDVVQDASVLIDLIRFDLLKSFVSLGFKNYTTDIVFNEVQKPKELVCKYVQTKMIQQIFTLTIRHKFIDQK
jgi:hypothetical protein